MHKELCLLPQKYVESFFGYFKSVGLKPNFEIVEELLYEIGRTGLTDTNALRYCKMGDKRSFEAFKTIEEIGSGKVWEHQLWKGKDMYLLACHYKD